jgi:hypothetical protein
MSLIAIQNAAKTTLMKAQMDTRKTGDEPEYAPRECSELQGFPRTEVIQCPQCSKTQSAQVHFERWMPFPAYVHDCECGYTITESDWDVVANASLTLAGKEG